MKETSDNPELGGPLPGSPAWREELRQATEFFTLIDEQDRLVYVSAEERLPNYPGLLVYNLVPPDSAEVLRSKLTATRTTGLPQRFEIEAAGPNGESSHYSSWVCPVEYEGGRGVAFISIDITDQRRMATALERSETWLRAMIAQAPDVIVVADRERRIELVNRAPLGLNKDDMLGRALEEFVPEADRKPIIDIVERVFERGEVSEPYETWIRGPEGELPASGRFGPIRVDGKVERVILISRDVSAEHHARRLKEQLHQAQKMEAIGELTGGIAHDFNNLLTAVCGHLELIEECEASEEVKMLAADARAAGERAAELTARLLAFARNQTLKPRRVLLSDLVENMVSLLRRTLGEKIQIVTEFSASLPQCDVDPVQLETAVLNLCLNARDAMPGGGRLMITTEPRSAATGGQPLIVLAVTDSGEGMPADVLKRACEPFFTTKGVGDGSGLGLSMVYGFVQQSGGELDIQSEPGQGTRVELRFPLSGKPAPPPTLRPEASIQKPKGHGERILVVEDEPQVANLVERRLRGWGYSPVVVHDAAAALARLERESSFDLLFTDLGLPGGMNGSELAHAALSRYPSLGLLLTTGYGADQTAMLSELPTRLEVLSKPYRSHQLAESIERALGADRD